MSDDVLAPIVQQGMTQIQAIDLTEKFSVTAEGIVVSGEPEIEEWGLAITQAARLGNLAMWAIGDLINYGESREWGEMYTQYIELTQRSYFTLANAVRVSRAFPPGESRRYIGSLSFSHHRETLPISEEKDRMRLLKMADEFQWSRDELRDRVVEARGHKPLKVSTETTTLEASTDASKRLRICPKCNHEWMAAK